MGKFNRWLGRTFSSKDNRCPDEERCLDLIRVMLDDESTEDDKAYILQHIEECYRCYDNFDLENAIRELVRLKYSHLSIPQEVVSEIRAKIEVH